MNSSSTLTAYDDLATPEVFEPVPLLRHSYELTVLYTVAYGAVFFTGVLGNTFVVLAVWAHKTLNITTDYLILSLALADLFILWVCLPTTLINSIFTEWLWGQFFCRLSTWANASTSFASVYTLVAVTADRYLAICHTLKYNTSWDREYTKYVIFTIWFVAAIFGIPNWYNYDLIVWHEGNYGYRLCTSQSDQKLYFLCVNLLLAFIIPFGLISGLYTKIFITVSTHRSLAVDARAREDRTKLRVATMMLTVIIVFACCWLPLYCIFTYFFFFADQRSDLFQITSMIIRPIFQWMSLLSSSLNPIIYIAYSHKYRRAFKTILLMPCKSRYERVRSTILRRHSQISRAGKSTATISMSNCGTEHSNLGGAASLLIEPNSKLVERSTSDF
uniref:G_PROTEIN_RECEP_F1_2 domain-containing protein n=1 Tax=Caenorhabditis japonica TaxID=281687 RepID=A0A8R1HQ46_CAEJA